MLTLICPRLNTPDEVPVILGTNASLFNRLAAQCDDSMSKVLARALKVPSFEPRGEPVSHSMEQGDPDDTLGLVRWMGLGQLTFTPQESHCVPCQVDFSRSETKGIVVGEASDAMPLPQGMIFQPVIAPLSAIDPKCFSLLIQNETKKEVVVPPDTPLGSPKSKQQIWKLL